MVALAAALVVTALLAWPYCGVAGAPVMQEQQKLVVPAIFAFGDSLIDAGNNNALRTLAKANFLPYGRDFPTHTATGRFVNGYTGLDYLALKFGLPLTPAHSDPSTKGAKLLHGVNFASAASGIQPYTGHDFGKVFSLDGQIQQFAGVKQELMAMIGANATIDLLSTAIFYIETGSNDWLNTYLIIGSPLPSFYTRLQFRDLLIAKLISQIKELYSLGARRIAVSGLGAFGCCPSQMRAYKSVNGTCVGWLNDLAKDYNDHLRAQVLALQDTLPSSLFAFQDPYTALLNIRENSSAYGFSVVDHACCGVGAYGGFLDCFQGFPVCSNAASYLFWDAYHPTSRFFELFLELVWNSGPPYSYPVSVKDIIARAYA